MKHKKEITHWDFWIAIICTALVFGILVVATIVSSVD